MYISLNINRAIINRKRDYELRESKRGVRESLEEGEERGYYVIIIKSQIAKK